MQKVGNTMKDNMDAVVNCANVMKTLYEDDDRLSQDIVYKELGALKGNFDCCLGATREMSQSA